MANPPLVTFCLESWGRYYGDPDREALWIEHYAEIAVDKARMGMRPHVAFYESLEACGALQVLTARSAGRMIGYFLTVIKPHPHYADVLCAFEDSYFMAKEHRLGTAGIRLIREAEKEAKRRGAKKIFCMTKTFKNLSRLYEHLGYVHSDEVFSKWIGD